MRRQARLDYGLRTLALQDFRHLRQEPAEKVGDFIRRTERLFQQAYGRDSMKPDAREMLLFNQLQQRLKLSLMEAPAVSGVSHYETLYLTAKKKNSDLLRSTGGERTNTQWKSDKTCWNCGKPGHLSKDCNSKKTESKSYKPQQGPLLDTDSLLPISVSREDPYQYLQSDSEENSSVAVVQLADQGSKAQRIVVNLEGVPVDGLVDTGADITIVGKETFKKVPTVAKLKKKHQKDLWDTTRGGSSWMAGLIWT